MLYPVALTTLTGMLTVGVIKVDQSGTDIVGPIISTGLVGIILVMVIFRIKIMPTYVFDDAKAAWDLAQAEKVAEIKELKDALRDANTVYTKEVIPTLTRVLDSERELVDLRRDEASSRRRADHD